MKPNSRVAVVILNWNGLSLLQRFLEKVILHSVPLARVVVADNGSTDGSQEWIRSSYPDLQLVELGENYGFAEGYNRALREVEAEYYMILNSDVEVSPDWLIPLIELLDNDPKIAALQPKILSYYNRAQFEYAGGAGGFIDMFGFPFCRGRILSSCEQDTGQYDDVRNIFWATGAALMIRSELYHSNGGFDDIFFAHQEEIDLCWRLKRRGHSVVVAPASVVYHMGGGTLPEETPFKVYLNFRNNIAMLYKNLHIFRFILLYFFVRVFTDLFQAFAYTLRGKFRLAGATLRGHRDFWRMRHELNRHREFGFRSVGDIYRGSIVLRYLFGNRRFGNIL